MKLKEAIKDTNKKVLDFVKHDHWEVKAGFDLIKQGFSSIFSGFRYWFRWALAMCFMPFIPVIYPIAILIRVLKK